MKFSTDLATVFAKVETTAGTAIALASADADFLAMNLKVSRDKQMTDRKYATGDHGRHTSVPGKDMVTISFECPVKTSSSIATAPGLSKLLKACGMKETVHSTVGVSWVPHVDSDKTTLTIMAQYRGYGDDDGLQVKGVGCMGNCKVVQSGVGDTIVYQFEFKGKTGSWDDNVTSVTVPTLPTSQLDALSLSSVITLDAVAQEVDKWELDFGNQIEMAINPADATGYLHAYVASRKPSFSWDPAVSLNSGINTNITAGVTAAFAFTTASGKFDVTIPALQVVEQQIGDRGGIVTYELKGLPVRGSGNDEFELVQGAKV